MYTPSNSRKSFADLRSTGKLLTASLRNSSSLRSSSTEKNERRLQQELRDLQAQFDSLKEDAKKVAQQYRNDRKRFRDAHYWMFVEPLETKGKQTQILDSKAEEKRLLHRRRELLRELGSGLMKLCDVNRVTLERVILGTNGAFFLDC